MKVAVHLSVPQWTELRDIVERHFYDCLEFDCEAEAERARVILAMLPRIASLRTRAKAERTRKRNTLALRERNAKEQARR